MSIHRLTAGSGYDYLTRQVAALDATEKGHTGLASYYTERGETPGGVDRFWLGRDRRPDWACTPRAVVLSLPSSVPR